MAIQNTIPIILFVCFFSSQTFYSHDSENITGNASSDLVKKSRLRIMDIITYPYVTTCDEPCGKLHEYTSKVNPIHTLKI